MRFFENYMDDVVVREDDDGNRFVRTESCRKGEELGPCSQDNKVAFGGESFGYFHVLDPITEELYWSYGVTWKYGAKNNDKVPIEQKSKKLKNKKL